jgi:hypothetical protein
LGFYEVWYPREGHIYIFPVLRIFIQKFTIWFFSLSLLTVLISFIHIPNEYIYKKFENTQYNKINWFLQKIENGDFKEKKYKGVFFGSSQCYYGINDSILGPDFLNLGMNTPSRDMDLYMYEMFVNAGGKTKKVYTVIGGEQMVSYGIHPLMPYLVTPEWFVRHGQSIFSLHFYKYILIRAQKVSESCFDFLLKSKQYLKFTRPYGVGYLDRTVFNRTPRSNFIKIPNRYVNSEEVNFYEEFRHNMASQWRFFDKFKDSKKLLLPSFQINAEYRKISNSMKVIGAIIIDLDSLNGLNENYQNWADPGHLNRQGAIKFSLVLKERI